MEKIGQLNDAVKKEGQRVSKAEESGSPRLLRANRRQMRFRSENLETVVAPDHRVRLFDLAVSQLDLARFYDAIEARGSAPGRSAIDPRILITLWLYGTSEGVGSARELARLSEEHNAYRWICGGVTVNHHTLSDFRVEHEAALDELMSQLLAVMMRQGIVRLKRVSQDGMKVRASAGAASFRRKKTLVECLESAKAHVAQVKRDGEKGDQKRSAREQRAAERAAKERQQRVKRALHELKLVRAIKPTKEEKREARASLTDPESRVMKLADGGFRPAFNVQLATDTESRVIVGTRVINRGNDAGQMMPMLEEIRRRTARLPKDLLVDGGFAQHESITEAEANGVTVYAPLQDRKRATRPMTERRSDDTDAVAAWRRRMGSARGKKIYKQRCSTAETTNADLRTWRGLNAFLVRGIHKATCAVLWAALAHNILRWIAHGGLVT